MTASTDDYVKLITSEHADKPNFTAVIRAMTSGFVDANNLALNLPSVFSLDNAVGAQLDAIGLWVGVSRQVLLPIAGVYFTWDGTAANGWDVGAWLDPNQAYGFQKLDDRSFRTMIRAKIAANYWDGTIADLYACYDYVFGPNVVFIQDNMDMSCTIIYDSTQMDAISIALLTGGYLKLKTDGVRFTYVAAPSSALFAWDANLPKFQGWTGTSVWAAGV
jgi:hypothetical protein